MVLTGALLFLALQTLGLPGLAGAFVGTLALTLSAYMIKIFGGKSDELGNMQDKI